MALISMLKIITGLSPRVRGNHFASLSAGDNAGSIPACAGEPAADDYEVQLISVYPRVCGGTRINPRSLNRSWGLSPRVRGNHPASRLCINPRGSIPACAGEPGLRHVAQHPPWVYPRVCGGTALHATANPDKEGLSPRVRGNPVFKPPEDGTGGSIPACAGEPPPHIENNPHPSVYPRVCGGTPLWSLMVAVVVGLSPRVRGTVISVRSCAMRWGLSPRVRGNLGGGAEHPRERGSIPACAGEPRERLGRKGMRGVYPRVCGGTASYCRVTPTT